MYKSEKQEYDDSIIKNDPYTIKKAFKYFGEKFVAEMEEFYKQIKNLNSNEQNYLMLKFMILKLRVDDKIYLKYKVNEIQLRYLLFKKDLNNDPEIKEVYEKIEKLQERLNII